MRHTKALKSSWGLILTFRFHSTADTTLESSDGDDWDKDNLEFFNHFDSLKPNYETFEGQLDNKELGDMDELLELSTKDLTDSMVEFLVEDDDNDLDWLPERVENVRKCQLTLLSVELGSLARLQHNPRST